jgi:hypothetical protein
VLSALLYHHFEAILPQTGAGQHDFQLPNVIDRFPLGTALENGNISRSPTTEHVCTRSL